jgi:hypothetical protein
MDRSKLKKLGVLLVIAGGISVLPIGAAGEAHAQAQHVRWDIASVSPPFPPGDITAGGSASAAAGDGSTITLTGTGTFVAPASGKGSSSAATGGGTWEIFPSGSTTASASGTYQVERLVRFDEAPGSLAGLPLTDLIGNPEDAHAGLAILAIDYSDGDRGVLVVACMLNMPGTLVEGVSATKGFVDYFNIMEHITLFHIPD